MPHATEEMSTHVVNGAKPTSKFLDHLTTYPVVSDGVETFKSNSYGKKSLELVDSAYQKLGKPVEPYLETPYSYVKPYATKADELASSGLGHVETRFPIVKDETSTIVDKGKSFVFWPFKVAGEGKDYVVTTYYDEYDKTAKHKERGPGLSTLLMAVVSTELKIASDFFQVVADYLGPKYEESKQKGADYVQEAKDTAEAYKAKGQEKVQEYSKLGQEKASEYQKVGEEKKEQTKEEVKKAKEEAQKKAQK